MILEKNGENGKMDVFDDSISGKKSNPWPIL
jgi:hypothetical protein